MPVTITENTSIDYDINGEGSPLLLISGLGFGRWGWFKQVPAFSRHFRTITFDIRGERRLENGVDDLVREVVSLLDHLGVKKAHVFGASLGGFVGQSWRCSGPTLSTAWSWSARATVEGGLNRCPCRPCGTCSGGVPSVQRAWSGAALRRRPPRRIVQSTKRSSSSS